MKLPIGKAVLPLPDRPSIEHPTSSIPSLPQRVLIFSRAVARNAVGIARGNPLLADEETIKARQASCDACEHYIPSRDLCAICGCRKRWKIRLRTEHCPIARW